MAVTDRCEDALHRARLSVGDRLLREVGFAGLSLNSKLRDEFLNREALYTLREAQVLIEWWRRHYNTLRPHSSLGYRGPAPTTILRAAFMSPYAEGEAA